MLHSLAHYVESWQLSNPELLAETETSHIYTVTFQGTRVVLKLLDMPGGGDEINGATALRFFDGRGCVRLLEGDDHAHLLEYANGEPLLALVERGNDENATAVIADILTQLHTSSAHPPPKALLSLKRWFRSLFNKAKQDQEANIESIYRRGARLAEHLLSRPLDERVLHGDIHHLNIRHHRERGWLAFDPKGLVGERTYDAANALCNPMSMPHIVEDKSRFLSNAAVLAAALNVDVSRLHCFTYAYACLSASWTLEDGQSPTQALRIAGMIEPHIRSAFSAF